MLGGRGPWYSYSEYSYRNSAVRDGVDSAGPRGSACTSMPNRTGGAATRMSSAADAIGNSVCTDSSFVISLSRPRSAGVNEAKRLNNGGDDHTTSPPLRARLANWKAYVVASDLSVAAGGRSLASHGRW